MDDNCLAVHHERMKRLELQHLTTSEPLTLEQEYDMQGSWREDDDRVKVKTNSWVSGFNLGQLWGVVIWSQLSDRSPNLFS
uniref:N-acetyltransferase 9-like protein n=1 Tax=Monopterus albus TaxID=43700 RepID=UPI0009B2F1DB|nr:N-acetyltransferase 9-like protein [Monopterus albus]